MNIYEQKLSECLARGGFDGQQTQIMLVKFKVQASRTSEREAFRDFVNQWGNEDAEKALASIQTELERMNREHPKIEITPTARISNYVKRQNKIMEDASKYGIDGIELDAEKLKVKLPSFCVSQAATWQDKQVPMELEIICR
jgi:hypothetical protein